MVTQRGFPCFGTVHVFDAENGQRQKRSDLSFCDKLQMPVKCKSVNPIYRGYALSYTSTKLG